ncbi:MAG: electron transport complex subunit RsxC, partial [bacterium]
VEAIKEIMTPSREMSPAIIIKTGAVDKKRKENTEKSLERLSSDEIRSIVQEAGITGMGGASFPTHVKISIPEDKNIDYFILNGAECEPYLTIDNRIMIEKFEEVLHGMKVLMKGAGVKNGIIAIEDNKPEAISVMRKAVKDEENIEVKIFETKYPQGGEKLLIKAALDREVPVGGLPLDVGVVVNNVTTAFATARALKEGLPLIERPVTVTGPGIENPMNLIVPIGTPIEKLIEAAGGFSGKPGKVIAGGPMMGIAQSELKVPVIKGTSGILVIPEEQVKDYTPSPCINCARCVDSCPMRLVPTRLVKLVENEMYEETEQYQINNCIECGSCSYVCPSNIPLVHHIRIGKSELNARKRDNNG